MTNYNNKNILAIDCVSSELKLGLQFGGDRLVKSNTGAKQSHSSLIVGKIQSLLESAGCKVNDLDAIVVATGPGSFTGLRIGIACAKGMGVALNIPVVGVNLFEIAAYKLAGVNSKVKVVLPFKKDEVFTAVIENGKFNDKSIETVMKKDLEKDVEGMEVAGAGIDLPQFSVAHNVEYDATELIYLGIEKLSGDNIPDLAALEPLYVQKSQAEIRFERNQDKANEA